MFSKKLPQKTDMHLHSKYSSDVPAGTGAEIDQICRRAIELDIGTISITDHYDIDGILDGYFPPLDIEGVRRDIFAAKEKYHGRLNIVYGLELGQANHKISESNELLDKNDFEFVIGSVHAVEGIIDFSCTDLNKMTDSQLRGLLDRYIYEMYQLIEWGRFSSLAHLTYPYRYFKFAGRENIIPQKENENEMFEGLLREIIKKGIPLEVNTSGLRQGIGQTFPNYDIVKHYKSIGGALVTVGSDAHFLQDIGAGIDLAVAELKAIGFEYICSVENNSLIQIPI